MLQTEPAENVSAPLSEYRRQQAEEEMEQLEPYPVASPSRFVRPIPRGNPCLKRARFVDEVLAQIQAGTYKPRPPEYPPRRLAPAPVGIPAVPVVHSQPTGFIPPGELLWSLAIRRAEKRPGTL